MTFDKITEFFLPREVKENKAHPRYDEFRVVSSSIIIGASLMALFPLILLHLGKPVAGYYLNAGLLTLTLFSMRIFGHYRIPMLFTAGVSYFIVYSFLEHSGLIFSTSMGMVHMYLLSAIWVDKKWGWWAIFTNILFLLYVYNQSVDTGLKTATPEILGSPLHALIMNCFITIFLGVFLAYEQFDQEQNRKKIRSLQDEKIGSLDDAVKKRTEQLSNMRQAMATDFHDETGNMLSSITRQASLLKIKLDNTDVAPIVESIIKNSNDLYASSKDFLWNLNHDSDDPSELFSYLTGYGQLFYNQFDIAFSSTIKGEIHNFQQLDPFAALNLIFIFKEAMTNVIKHANAREVIIEMTYTRDKVIYTLQDNGKWKLPDESQPHHGLTNIERRCKKNHFDFLLLQDGRGTRIEIGVPVNIYFV